MRAKSCLMGVLAFIAGMITDVVLFGIFVCIADNSDQIYTNINVYMTFFILFFVSIFGAIVVEALMDTSAREVLIDAVITALWMWIFAMIKSKHGWFNSETKLWDYYGQLLPSWIILNFFFVVVSNPVKLWLESLLYGDSEEDNGEPSEEQKKESDSDKQKEISESGNQEEKVKDKKVDDTIDIPIQ